MQARGRVALAGAALVVGGLLAWGLRAQPAGEPVRPDDAPSASAERDRIAVAELPRCPDRPEPAELGVKLRLKLHLGAGVDPVRAHEILSAARRYWQPYAVEVEQVGESERLELRSLFGASFSELEQLDEEALGDALYGPLRELISSQAQPPRALIHVVVLEDIVEGRAAAAAVLGDLVGLTLAPQLLSEVEPEDPRARIVAQLGLEAFDATVLLSERHLRRLEGVGFVGAVAHELGHALGLEHHDERHNLMARGRHLCLPGLDEAQVEALRERSSAP